MSAPASLPGSDLVADLTSGDATRIWSASSAVNKLRDPAALDRLARHIPEIVEKTTGVDLGGRVGLNSVHLDFALKKLRYWKARKGCLCRLYPTYDFFRPEQEAEAGNVRIEETKPLPGGWGASLVCACTVCGTRYKVDEREYHFTWWKWDLLKIK